MELTLIILLAVIIFLAVTVIEQAKEINKMHVDQFGFQERTISDYKTLNR